MSESEDTDATRQNFICSCCNELMVDPTTLTCGHSFCRLCLARWWYTNAQNNCLYCRQPWHGYPQVNTTLRSTIELMYQEETLQRRRSINDDPESREILKKFKDDKQKLESILVGLPTNRQEIGQGRQNQVKACLLITGAVIVSLVMLIRWLAGAAGEDITLKPVQSWSTDDVATWIASLGSWAQNDYLEKFRTAEVNGRLLLLVDEQGLDELSVTSSLHKKAFIEAVEHLKTKGVRLANNLWEFKTAHRQHTMWVTIGLTGFPRLLIIYSYFYNYHDTYLPFVHYIVPPSDEDPDSDIDETLAKSAPPSWRQSIDFWFKVFLTPYYLIGSFMWSWMSVHFWIGLVVVLYSIAMTVTEAASIPTILKHPSIYIRIMINQSLREFIMWWLIMAILWHITPAFLCDIAFYWMVYMSPVRACFSAFKSIQGMLNYQPEP